MNVFNFLVINREKKKNTMTQAQNKTNLADALVASGLVRNLDIQQSTASPPITGDNIMRHFSARQPPPRRSSSSFDYSALKRPVPQPQIIEDVYIDRQTNKPLPKLKPEGPKYSTPSRSARADVPTSDLSFLRDKKRKIQQQIITNEEVNTALSDDEVTFPRTLFAVQSLGKPQLASRQNYQNLNTLLNTLRAQSDVDENASDAEKIISQRDAYDTVMSEVVKQGFYECNEKGDILNSVRNYMTSAADQIPILCDQLNKQKEQAEKQISDLRTENESMNKKNDQLSDQKVELEKQFETAKNRLAFYESKVPQLEDEARRLRLQSQHDTSELEALKLKLDKTKEKYRKLKREKMERAAIIEEMSNQINLLKRDKEEAQKIIDDLKAQIERLQKDNDALKDEIKKLKLDLERAKENNPGMFERADATTQTDSIVRRPSSTKQQKQGDLFSEFDKRNEQSDEKKAKGETKNNNEKDNNQEGSSDDESLAKDLENLKNKNKNKNKAKNQSQNQKLKNGSGNKYNSDMKERNLDKTSNNNGINSSNKKNFKDGSNRDANKAFSKTNEKGSNIKTKNANSSEYNNNNPASSTDIQQITNMQSQSLPKSDQSIQVSFGNVAKVDIGTVTLPYELKQNEYKDNFTKLLDPSYSDRPPKPFEWILKSLRSIFDEKSVKDATDTKEGKKPVPMPVYTLHWSMRQYGLDYLAHQCCWDLVNASRAHQHKALEIETFRKFLDEDYSTQQLTFFLRVRTVCLRRGITLPVKAKESDERFNQIYLTTPAAIEIVQKVFSKAGQSVVDQVTKLVNDDVIRKPASTADQNITYISMISLLNHCIKVFQDYENIQLKKMMNYYNIKPKMDHAQFEQLVKELLPTASSQDIAEFYRLSLASQTEKKFISKKKFVSHFAARSLLSKENTPEIIQVDNLYNPSPEYEGAKSRWKNLLPSLDKVLEFAEKRSKDPIVSHEMQCLRLEIDQVNSSMTCFDVFGMQRNMLSCILAYQNLVWTLKKPDIAMMNEVTDSIRNIIRV